jgi:hypothetical protein
MCHDVHTSVKKLGRFLINVIKHDFLFESSVNVEGFALVIQLSLYQLVKVSHVSFKVSLIIWIDSWS